MSSRRKQSKPRFLKDDGGGKEMGAERQDECQPDVNSDKVILASEASSGQTVCKQEPINQSCSGLAESSDIDVTNNSEGVISPQLIKRESGGPEANDTSGLVYSSSNGASTDFPYSCVVCTKAFAELQHLVEHESLHSTDLPYLCKICERPFRHKRSRDRHMKLHTGDKNYKCSICDAAFSRSDHLKNHSKSHTFGKAVAPSGKRNSHDRDEDSKSELTLSHQEVVATPGTPEKKPGLRCQLCSEVFTNYYQLDEHIKSHSSSNNLAPIDVTKPLEYHCTHCAKQSLKQVFASLQALEQHVQHMHTGKGLSLLSCTHCELAFPTVPTLNHHIETEHKPQAESNHIRKARPDTNTTTVAKKPQASAKPIRMSLSPMPNSLEGSDLHIRCHICSSTFINRAALLTHLLLGHPNLGGEPGKETTAPLDLSSSGSPGSESPCTYTCTHCTFHTGSVTSLLEHHRQTHNESEAVKCSGCNDKVTSAEEHQAHIERHFLSCKRQYTCQACRQVLSSATELRDHLLLEHSRTVHKCLLCNEIFYVQLELQDHLVMEHGRENDHYKCCCCGCVFDKRVEWKQHLYSAHADVVLPLPDKGKYDKDIDVSNLPCPYCTKKFTNEALLSLHIFTHQKSFPCSMCDQTFQVEYFRDKHMQSVHVAKPLKSSPELSLSTNLSLMTSTSPYWCNICDRVFHSEDVFLEHKKKSHSFTKPWQTSLEADRQTASSALQPTMFSTTCNICGKAFKNYTELDKHSRVHFGPISLPCVICDETFNSLAELSQHRLLHCKVSGMKPCILCHTTIGDSQSYLDHAPTHVEKDSTVVCAVCKHNITSQAELELHAKHHFPFKEKSSLSCVSCGKPCPNNVSLPQVTDNSKFLMCKECIITRKSMTRIVLPSRVVSEPHPMSPSTSNFSLPSSPTGSDHKERKSSYGSMAGLTSQRCKDCQVKFETQSDYDNHSCLNKPCSRCSKTFRITDLICRLNSYTCKECDSMTSNLWRCEKCKLTFTREDKYQRHNCMALGEGKVCALCQGVFKHSQLLLRGDKQVCKNCDDLLIVCQSCSVSYMKGVHDHVCRLPCSRCHEIYRRRPADLTPDQPLLCNVCTDVGSTQASRKVYQCIKCQQSYASEEEIKAHILNYHVNDKTHQCYLCSSMFDTPAKLQHHLIDHSFGFTSSMKCPKCELLCSTSQQLLSHCLNEHNMTSRGYSCVQCHQSFFFKAELANHLHSHQDPSVLASQPSPPFTHKKLDRKRHLSPDSNESDSSQSGPASKHGRLDISDNDSASDDVFCTKCDSEFVDKEQYQEHVATHHSESAVVCATCGRLYSTKVDLTDHQTLCHPHENLSPSFQSKAVFPNSDLEMKITSTGFPEQNVSVNNNVERRSPSISV